MQVWDDFFRCENKDIRRHDTIYIPHFCLCVFIAPFPSNLEGTGLPDPRSYSFWLAPGGLQTTWRDVWRPGSEPDLYQNGNK